MTFWLKAGMGEWPPNNPPLPHITTPSFRIAHLLLAGLSVLNERLHLLAELLQGPLILLKCDLGVEDRRYHCVRCIWGRTVGASYS